MTAEGFCERSFELAGWPVHLTSYRLGEDWVCTVDNVSPGARIARATGSAREEAEDMAIRKAEKRLGTTRRQSID